MVIAISQNEILSEIWITKITYMNFSMSELFRGLFLFYLKTEETKFQKYVCIPINTNLS